MRVTNQMLTNNFLYGLNNLQNQMQEYLLQLSTGSQINTPGENPLGTGQAMRYSDILSQTNAFSTNVSDGVSWLQNNDSALQNASSILQTVQQVATQAVGGTMNSTDLKAIAQQVNTSIQNMIQVGNTAYGNIYVFGGTDTGSVPFTYTTGSGGLVNGVTYNGNSGTINREIGPAYQTSINLTGSQVFGQGSLSGTGYASTSPTETSSSAALGLTGNLTVSVGGTSTASIAVTNTDSLTAIAANINSALTTAGLSATAAVVPNTDNGITTYTLNITSNSPLAVTPNTSGLTFNTGPVATFAPGASGVFQDLLNLSQDLQNAATPPAGTTAAQWLSNISSTDLTNVKNDLTSVTVNATANGTRLQQFQAAQSNLSAFQVNVTNLQGKVQGVDMAKTMSNYTSIQTAYQASLQSGASLMPPSLFTYLKL